MSHTKGPWAFVPWHIAEGPPEVRSPEGWLICTTPGDDDARLIASAPDLLEALQTITDCAEAGSLGVGMDLWIKHARAAIAKAKGK
jgi:hypothetical protein